MRGTLSDKRLGLYFTVVAWSCQCSLSWVWVPRESWSFSSVSNLGLSQSGGPGSCIYYPQVQVNLQPSVIRPVSCCRAPIWSSWPDFCFLFDDCGFFYVGHPLWQADGSVIYLYNCFRALPEQSLLGQSPAELRTIFYCLNWDSPNLKP
jgi:hypothetical protein